MTAPPLVYIAGPMTGYQGFNFPAFHDAEEHLRLLGFAVLNPAHNGSEPGRDWAWYMRLDIQHVVSADAICLLPDWEASRGACLEVHIAHALGVPTIPLKAWSRTTLGARLDPVCMVPECGCSGPVHA